MPFFCFGMMVDNVDWETDWSLVCQWVNKVLLHKISAPLYITSNC